MGSGAERVIRRMSAGELMECAEWLADALGQQNGGEAGEGRGDIFTEYGRQAPEGARRRWTSQELLYAAAERVMETERETARRAEAETQRPEDEREPSRTRQLFRRKGTGASPAGTEGDSVPGESAGAAPRAGEGTAAPGMNEISEFFRRDSRRYDGGFVRY